MEIGQDRETAGASRGSWMGKRLLDLLLAVPMLLLALPVIVLSAVGSALVLRAWPFFAQERVGRHGQPITVIKVRTLPVTTPQYCSKHDLRSVALPAFTRWLRALHIDELPQLLLVIRGTMTLVGPRPEMRTLHEAMPGDDARVRTSVPPGCTGLWQISDASRGLIEEAPQYDQFYVEHRSVRLDLWVLLQTCRAMVLGQRIADLDHVPLWARRDASGVAATTTAA